MIRDLEKVAGTDIARLRSQLAELLGKTIRLVPEGDHLVAELTVDYPGLLAQTRESKLNVVAGAGFEPTTFGL